MPDFNLFDYLSVGWFWLVWAGYTYFADHSRFAERSLPAYVDRERRRWTQEMMCRELRMVDTLIVGNLVRGIAFFASTAILLVGGLLALLGSTDAAVETLSDLPFTAQASRINWEIKVLFLATIFIYAFAKFVWAFRLSNYTSIMIGAAPAHTSDEAEREQYAQQLSRLSAITGRHFNRGLRANFFALAALGWFVHWALFVAGTTWVLYLLHRREFRSEALKALKKLPDPR